MYHIETTLFEEKYVKYYTKLQSKAGDLYEALTLLEKVGDQRDKTEKVCHYLVHRSPRYTVSMLAFSYCERACI